MSDAPAAVADTVHYVSYGTPGGEYSSQCRAATVAEVGAWMEVAVDTATESDPNARWVKQEWLADAAHLVVLNPTGMFFKACRYDALPRDPKPPLAGTWHHVHEHRDAPKSTV